MIVTTDKTSYGFRASLRGALRAEDASAWLARLRDHLDAAATKSFDLVLDLRGLALDTVSAERAAVSALRRLDQSGMGRLAIVAASARQLLDVRRLAEEGKVLERTRILSPAIMADAEKVAVRWAAEGMDEVVPRQSERRAELALFMDALSEPLLLCDLQGSLLHMNASMERTLAAEPEQHRLRRALDTVTRGPRTSAVSARDHEVRTTLQSYRVRQVAVGDGLCAPAGAQLVSLHAVVSQPLTDDDLRDRFGLTAREIEIARLLAGGRTNAEIARQLGISPFTSRNHTERILGKLGIANRARVAAVLMAA